jgi:mRNA-degrading endonuclease YafQ of YafQ-DinJ toxin-antitoxin module
MQIDYSSNFKKRIRKLPKPIVEKFYIRLALFEQDRFNPVLNNHKLHGEYEGSNSINVTGDFRAIFKYINENYILFSDIGTHPELYE